MEQILIKAVIVDYCNKVLFDNCREIYDYVENERNPAFDINFQINVSFEAMKIIFGICGSITMSNQDYVNFYEKYKSCDWLIKTKKEIMKLAIELRKNNQLNIENYLVD